MLRVLLVDDEPFILHGLSIIIDWAGEGFEIIGQAGSALDALKILEEEDPDLVIADIKMPQMTGLELLEKVRKENISGAAFVMLSGYSDFEYTRKAMQFGCLDFMPKPVNRDELLKVLDRVRQMKKDEERKKLDDSLMEKEMFSRNMIPVILGKHDKENLSFVKQYLGDLHGVRYISVELDNTRSGVGNVPEEEKRKYQKTIYQRCLKHMQGKEYRCVFDVSLKNENYDVGIIYSEDLAEDETFGVEQTFLDHLKEAVVEGLDFPVKFFVGSKVESLGQISESAQTVLVARTFRDFEMGEAAVRSQENNWSIEDNRITKQNLDELIHAVEVNQKEDIVARARDLFEDLKQEESRVISMVINYVLFRLFQLAMEADEKINQQEVLKFICDAAFEQVYVDDGQENLKQMMMDYSDYLVQLRGNQTQGVLKQIEEYIRENYKENLTLKDLSKKFYVNAAYLGQIFKKQYGESFKDYLNRVRIERAETLLLCTDLKIYEIVELIGYKDMDYFINKFITLKGCTPAKFRKQTAK